MTFQEALHVWQQDMKKRARIPEQEYVQGIYRAVTTPGFQNVYDGTLAHTVWAPEIYLMKNYKTEFLAWLKLQI